MKENSLVRISIYLPDELKSLMDDHSIENWSAIAQDAFKKKIDLMNIRNRQDKAAQRKEGGRVMLDAFPLNDLDLRKMPTRMVAQLHNVANKAPYQTAGELRAACEAVACGSGGLDWTSANLWPAIREDARAALWKVQKDAESERDATILRVDDSAFERIAKAINRRDWGAIEQAEQDRREAWESAWANYEREVAHAFADALWRTHTSEQGEPAKRTHLPTPFFSNSQEIAA